MHDALSNLINARGWCVADGATGTNLFNRGLETGYPPDLWSVERPDDVLWLHNEFLQDGSDLILTNSFGGTGPAELLHSVRGILTASGSMPVVAKGNCGIPTYVEGAIHYHGTPDLMAEYALFARDAGAKIIGGCCGTSPAHVAAMVAALDKTPPRDFDEAAMVAALGEAWVDVKIDNSVGDDRRKRRGRRRQA